MFKSRTLASAACEGGKVKIENQSLKPSRHIKTGEIVTVQQGYVKRAYKVLGLLNKRVSAQLAKSYIEDITPQAELDKLKTERLISYQSKFKGVGRPTKKDRRLIIKTRGY